TAAPPVGLPLSDVVAVSVKIAGAFSPDRELGYVLLAAVDLPAKTHDMHAARVFIIDREMIEDVAVFRSRPNLPAAHANGGYGVLADHPVHDVQVMHVLFANMVAGEPSEVKPVADLPFHIAPFRLARLHP